MYVNQIDNIIDQLLDKFYSEYLYNDATFQDLVNNHKSNFVEYRDKINALIEKFMLNVDIRQIESLINSRRNSERILAIIKRYIAYYYFLSLAFYYTDPITVYRNNLIKYSKLQENSVVTVTNFFDTENNFQIIKFFSLIHDAKRIMLMTELEFKALDKNATRDALQLLNSLGKSYIDTYLLTVTSDNRVVINAHNLIKTLVFREIYRNQEQKIVFSILNEIEEAESEYIYIQIVVTTEDAFDLENLKQMFIGYEDGDVLALRFYELLTESQAVVASIDTKNSELLKWNSLMMPIVDDFIRIHRETERLNIDQEFKFPHYLTTNTARNVQLAIMAQKKKSKEITKAQLIVNKNDVVSDYYSVAVAANPEVQREITRYFTNPFAYRKCVLHNYYEELNVLNKIINQKAIEANEYYMELKYFMTHAYFNFKDFQKYGVAINLTHSSAINMMRYSNIEFLKQMTRIAIDVRSGSQDTMANVVGFAFSPLKREEHVICFQKQALQDIRETTLHLKIGSDVKKYHSKNGFKMFLRYVKYFLINSIEYRTDGMGGVLYHDMQEILRLNPNLIDHIIYWTFDPTQDVFELGSYETLKSDINDLIRFMNSVLYDKIQEMLLKKLSVMLQKTSNLNIHDAYGLIQGFDARYFLKLTEKDKNEIFVQNYLYYHLQQDIPAPVTEIMPETIPTFHPIRQTAVFRMNINTLNPRNIQRHRILQAYGEVETEKIRARAACRHEYDWEQVSSLRNTTVNKYNQALTQFIDQYAIETLESDFICNICNQILPIRQYVQDGSFDNLTQRFVTSYVPQDVPLEQITEYKKYRRAILKLDDLTRRMALVADINAFSGFSKPVQQRRKALIKNTLDIVIRHNAVNLAKRQDENRRNEYFQSKFKIQKELDMFSFFEFSDGIFDFSASANPSEVNYNRIKFNIVVLYFVLVFITELNASQIMAFKTDRNANIYRFLEIGFKLYGDLRIKLNINDQETAKITNYPVLCYLVYVTAYFLVKYKIWYIPHEVNTQKLDPVILKVIVNSFVDMFNSIILDAMKNPDDYVYILIVSKIFSNMNDTYRNGDLLETLKRNHVKYSRTTLATNITAADTQREIILDATNIQPVARPPYHYPKVFMTLGLGKFYDETNIIYQEQPSATSFTNCPQGSFHNWDYHKPDLVCGICHEKDSQADAMTDRLQDCYFYNLNHLANQRCIETGAYHDFENSICSLCNRKANTTYQRSDLEALVTELQKIRQKNNDTANEINLSRQKLETETLMQKQAKVTALTEAVVEKTGSDTSILPIALYGFFSRSVDKFIDLMESSINSNSSFDLETKTEGKGYHDKNYPVYLRDDVYIIDHNYQGADLNQPIVLIENENKVQFKANHVFFKTDVYFYTDNRTQIDVFYYAVTLRLLGYKERHKDYTAIPHSGAYLKISYGVKNRLVTNTYVARYINIKPLLSDPSDKARYYEIMTSLIKEHVMKTKAMIDKFIMIIYKVKNYVAVPETETDNAFPKTETTIAISKIVEKYSRMINLNLSHDGIGVFKDWQEIRDEIFYLEVNWSQTNLVPPANFYVNTQDISYYDASSAILMAYLMQGLERIIFLNEGINRITVCQLFVDVINLIYNLHNFSQFETSVQLRRFEYILNGTEATIDVLRKGQGLIGTGAPAPTDTIGEISDDIETETTKEDLEDLREEAESIDADLDYLRDEDEDNVQYDDGSGEN